MKTFSYGLGLSFLILGSAFADEPQFSVAERGFNHRVWERTESRGDGRVVTGRYTELETGMHYVGEGGQWREVEAVIEITPTGAAALKGNHKVHFLANLNAPGAVDLVMRDGKRLTSHILGLSYFDSATGQSVLIAELKDSIGVLNPPNQVIYPDAFTDLKADVRYTYTKAGFEQDVIFREQFASPAEYGLNPQTTRLQLLTEFADPPVPRIETLAQGERRNDLIIDFGEMAMGLGKAFLIGEALPQRQIAVEKTWGKLAGRDFLIEEIDYPNVKTQLETLPLPAHALRKPGINGVRHLVSNERRLPERVANKTGRVPIRIAKLNPAEPGFVLDYSVMSSATNFTFKGDTTYYVSGLVNLSSNTVIEGGAVVKFTNFNAHVARSISITGTIDCRTGPYRPAVFTSKDDNTVGETISGSTGTPSGYYGDGLVIYTSGNALHDLRFSYLETGVSGVPIIGDLNLAHLQFVFCKRPVFFSPFTCGLGGCDNKLTLDNALIYSCDTAFFGENGTWRGQHVTVHDCNTLTYDSGNNATIVLTNSLLVAVTNAGNMPSTLVSTAESSSDTGVFQTVGAGSHYLADGSTNRNAGTTNINLTLANEIKAKTTYPRTEISSQTINVDTCWTPHVQRDNDLPDRGYHYDPLDRVVNAVTITNATLSLSGGVAVGVYGPSSSFGMVIRTGGKLVSEGSPTRLNHIARYNTVQEQSSANWSATNVADCVTIAADTLPVPQGRFRFTDWSLLGGKGYHFKAYAAVTTPFIFKDCQFGPGSFDSLSSVGITNCLFERTSILFYDQDETINYSAYNNLHRGGKLELYQSGSGTWQFRDNFFDETTISQSATITHDHNGYITNKNRLTPNGSGDKILTNSPVYLTGPLGKYYYKTNDGMLSVLIDAGSRSACAAGLAHFTTLTNQTQEGTNSTNTVDIGFHFVPVQGAEEIAKSGITASASSSESGNEPGKAIDHSDFDPGWQSTSETFPWVRLDLGASNQVVRLDYQQPEFQSSLRMASYEVYVTSTNSTSAADWGVPVADGTWHWQDLDEARETKFVEFNKGGRYVILRSLATGVAAADELWVYRTNTGGGTYVPTDINTNNFLDYLEGCELDLNSGIGLIVTIDDSVDCMGTNSMPQNRAATNFLSGGSEFLQFTLDVTVECVVEQQNPGFDTVTVNDIFFLSKRQQRTGVFDADKCCHKINYSRAL